VTCHNCRTECKRKGHDRKGNQRYQCRQCSKTFLEPQEKPLDGMYLPVEKAELVMKLLLEGNSVSSVERITEIHHTTILKLLVLAGEKCERIMAEKIRNVQVRDVECDELWAFIGKKQKRVRPQDDQNLGDCYTFVAIERHSKLVLNIAMGKRDQATTDALVEGIRHSTAHGKFQITTDGFAPYRSAITTTLHDRLTGFAQLIKVYGASQDDEARYSPAEVKSVEVVPVFGQPDPERICTSIIERQEPQCTDGYAPIHPAHKCFLEEMGEPLGRRRLLVRVLQLLPRSQVPESNARDGRRDCRSCVGSTGTAGSVKELGPGHTARFQPRRNE
jgi:transposase-like protein/IS1 family transposase